MFSRLAVVFGLSLALFGVGKISNAVFGVRHHGDAPFVKVENDNPELLAAHDKARKTIGEFWEALDRQADGEKHFSLKVRFPIKGYGDSGEHVWLLDIQREKDGTYSGRLDNKPRYLPTMKIGQRLSFTDDMISDWMFTRNGKIVGNASMRPLLARLPKNEADKLRAMLEDPS
jgi:uncharacterized protein YegJ (DUF2314 family)